MIPTDFQICQENIVKSPNHFCDVCVGATQQHQTTVNMHFQEFQKVLLYKTKNPFYYNQISR